MGYWERRLRTWTGLALAAFVLGHLINHSLGLISISMMESTRQWLAAIWRSPPGTAVLYGALCTHFALGLRSLYRRTTLRIPAWEAAQLWLGLSILPLLAGHIVGTRGGWQFFERTIGYEVVISALWTDPWLLVKQSAVLVVVSCHLMIGLHYWLRLRAAWRRGFLIWYPVAILLPLLAWLGFARVGTQLSTSAPAAAASTVSGLSNGDIAALIVLASIGGTLLARVLRSVMKRINEGYTLQYADGRRLPSVRGRSVLETLRDARIPHASVCGGRARCTTCRIRVGDGAQQLPPPSPLEESALLRIGAAPNVRLACQTYPTADLQITPLLNAHGVGGRGDGEVDGHERRITALFVDLRGSTDLAARKLPYDVLFILNQFFREMSASLATTGGHYAQFNGDGLLALYGLRGGERRSSRAALAGCVDMHRRIARLNTTLASELEQPLRIGVGIHYGNAIVGSMGPPQSPILTAIGDTINIAARLESLTKTYDCNLIVSQQTGAHAGVALAEFELRDVRLKGKDASTAIHVIDDIERLDELIESKEKTH